MLGKPDLTDVGDRRTNSLIGGLVLALFGIVVLAVVARLLLEPSLAARDLPIAGAALSSLAIVFVLNRSRFYRIAAFLFCFEFVWLNILEGLQRPDGPVWYALLPLSATLGGALLRFRQAVALACLSFLGVVLVLARTDAVSGERATLIVMFVALASSAALGLAVFRENVELERRSDLERLSAQLAARDRLESIGRLAGGIAHDFNNLLTVILSGADAARTGDLEALDDVVGAGQRAAVLTRQLLSFSRQPGRSIRSVPVDETLVEVRPLLRRLVPESIDLEFQLRAAAHVRLEDQQLEQMIFNLAANARDAMPSGGRLTIETITRRVAPGEVEQRDPGEYVVIRVTDTGVGMDEKAAKHAFELFFTTKRVGKGTGLGLATVQGIVRQAGGFVELVTAPGKGTRVDLALPRAPATAEHQPTPAAPQDRLEGLVLLVEDDPLVMRSTSRTLTALGLTVITASRADDVARVLDSAPEPPSLLVTDVVMPGRSGPQLVEELRARRPDLPVLVLSGYSHEDLQSLLSTPHTLFLVKPFSTPALYRALRELLPRRTAAPAKPVAALHD